MNIMFIYRNEFIELFQALEKIDKTGLLVLAKGGFPSLLNLTRVPNERRKIQGGKCLNRMKTLSSFKMAAGTYTN